MASPLQNRLVGTLILVALAVIILPDVLDGEKAETVEDFESIPLQPEQSAALQQPQPITDEVVEQLAKQPMAEASLDSEQALSATAESAGELESDAMDNEQLQVPSRQPQEFAADGKAFVIQLGAFSNQQSVEQLVAQLQQKGFAAYSEPSGQLTKLLVGPDTSQAELEKQLPVLTELTGLEGKIIPYQP
ncbi:MAG: SPOR domain-containing protein [Pseudomonadota bacterium]